jgi:hypothetical protein
MAMALRLRSQVKPDEAMTNVKPGLALYPVANMQRMLGFCARTSATEQSSR